MISPARTGIASALAAALLFGASTPVAKLLLRDADPWIIAALLYLGSGLGLAAVQAVRRGVLRRPPAEAPLRGHDWPWLAGATLAGGVVGPVLLLHGLAHTSAAGASLLLNLEAVFTATLAWFAFREHYNRRIVAGMIAIVFGGLVLSWPAQGEVKGSYGALAVAGACLAWGIDNNLTRKVSGGDPLQVAMMKGCVAGTVNLGIALAAGAPWPAAATALAIGAVGLVGYGVSLALFVVALRHVGTSRTSAYFSAAPFVGAVIAVTALGEPVTVELGIAGALFALGVALHLTERHEHEHVHEALVHEHRHVHDEHHQHEHEPGTTPRPEHSHVHTHAAIRHSHPHYPDLHHRHRH